MDLNMNEIDNIVPVLCVSHINTHTHTHYSALVSLFRIMSRAVIISFWILSLGFDHKSKLVMCEAQFRPQNIASNGIFQ